MRNIYKPDGKPANDFDRVMLLASWVRHLKMQGKTILFAGMGNPTFPTNAHLAHAGVTYWAGVEEKISAAHKVLSKMHRQAASSAFQKRDQIAEMSTQGSTIPYGPPAGVFEAREEIAKALNNWYGEQLNAEASDIFLPVGGAGALYLTFDILNKKNPNGVIITPFPFYSLYQGAERKNRLHPIHVMQERGYKLTATALEKSLESAKTNKLQINAFLFCDPCNPLGTIVDQSEWDKIATILRNYLQTNPTALIILDEAYAEMGLSRSPISLLTIAPDLAGHIILMRSATKGLSAAGERMALLFSKSKEFISACESVNTNIYGHAPISSQKIFATALSHLDQDELEEMSSHYKPQLELMNDRAIKMGINMPDPTYKPEGTFYILLDLSDLIGQPLSSNTQAALGNKATIETDEDICYHLLFTASLMITPASYFGLPPQHGFVRVTCSGGDTQLNQIMNRILSQINIARIVKKQILLDALQQKISTLRSSINKADASSISSDTVSVANNHLISMEALVLASIASSSPSVPAINNSSPIPHISLPPLLSCQLRRNSTSSSALSLAGSSPHSSDTEEELGASPTFRKNVKAEPSVSPYDSTIQAREEASKNLKLTIMSLKASLKKASELMDSLNPEHCSKKQGNAAKKIQKCYRNYAKEKKNSKNLQTIATILALTNTINKEDLCDLKISPQLLNALTMLLEESGKGVRLSSPSVSANTLLLSGRENNSSASATTCPIKTSPL